MKAKVQEKEKAIKLRRKGYSYKEILKEVPIAKSTLSNWIKELPLTQEEKISLKKRKDSNISRGRIKAASTLRKNRLFREQQIFKQAQKEFKIFSKDELFNVGIALYWAEGGKRNKYFSFSNSDVDMMKVMVEWSQRFLNINNKEIKAQLYIHRPFAHDRHEEYWSKHLNIPMNLFNKTIYKPTNRLIKKRPQYRGVLRISIFKKEFLLKTKFWINMMVDKGFKK